MLAHAPFAILTDVIMVLAAVRADRRSFLGLAQRICAALPAFECRWHHGRPSLCCNYFRKRWQASALKCRHSRDTGFPRTLQMHVSGVEPSPVVGVFSAFRPLFSAMLLPLVGRVDDLNVRQRDAVAGDFHDSAAAGIHESARCFDDCLFVAILQPACERVDPDRRSFWVKLVEASAHLGRVLSARARLARVKKPAISLRRHGHHHGLRREAFSPASQLHGRLVTYDPSAPSISGSHPLSLQRLQSGSPLSSA